MAQRVDVKTGFCHAARRALLALNQVHGHVLLKGHSFDVAEDLWVLHSDRVHVGLVSTHSLPHLFDHVRRDCVLTLHSCDDPCFEGRADFLGVLVDFIEQENCVDAEGVHAKVEVGALTEDHVLDVLGLAIG